MSIPVGSLYSSMPSSPVYAGQQAASPASVSPLGTAQASPGNPMSNLYSATGGAAPSGPAGMLYQIISMLMSVLSQLQGGAPPSQASPSASPAGNAGDSSNSGNGSSGSSANSGSTPSSDSSAGNAGGANYGSNGYGGGGGGRCHGHRGGHGGGSPSAGPSSPYGSPTPSSGGSPDGSTTPSSGGYPSPTSGGYPNATPSGTNGNTPGTTPSSGGGLGGGKEGLGVSKTSANGNGENLGSTKASWYYNWSPTASASNAGSSNATFIPMIWGSKNMNPNDLKAAANSKSPMLFTFNEPDHPGQANMSPQQALSYWDQLESTGKKLSSPAITNSDKPNEGIQWLDQFMQGAKAAGKRVDSISLHWYGDKAKSTQQNIADLKAHIDKVHQKYPNLPINLTEFGMNPDGNSAQQDPEFLAAAEKMLNGLPYVQMYSPYGLGNPNGNS